MKPVRIPYLLSGAAVVFALSASKCVHNTEIIPYVAEICRDVLDNDADGRVDCQDSDCDEQCRVDITIDQIPSFIPTDTLIISGSQVNATAIAVNVLPSGSGGTATFTGNTWTANLSLLSAEAPYTITAIGSDAQGRKDTATATFIRRN